MISYRVQKTYDGSKTYVEGVCLSTDQKPMNVQNGSVMIEMDTATLYLYDEQHKEWKAWI